MKKGKKLFSAGGELWSDSPHSPTCSPCRVLCHRLPGRCIPPAEQGMAQHSCPASLYPRSSGLAWGMAAGSVTATLGNMCLHLLGAGRAYLHSTSCPVWGPVPTLQALSTQVSCGSGAMWWGGSRDEHIQQNPKAHSPLPPPGTPIQGEPCGGFQPFLAPAPLPPCMGLTPVNPTHTGATPRLARAHGSHWLACPSREAGTGHNPAAHAPRPLPLHEAGGEKPPMPAPASPSLSNLAMSEKPWFPFHQKRSKLGNWLPAQMPLSLSHV